MQGQATAKQVTAIKPQKDIADAAGNVDAASLLCYNECKQFVASIAVSCSYDEP